MSRRHPAQLRAANFSRQQPCTRQLRTRQPRRREPHQRSGRWPCMRCLASAVAAGQRQCRPRGTHRCEDPELDGWTAGADASEGYALIYCSLLIRILLASVCQDHRATQDACDLYESRLSHCLIMRMTIPEQLNRDQRIGRVIRPSVRVPSSYTTGPTSQANTLTMQNGTASASLKTLLAAARYACGQWLLLVRAASRLAHRPRLANPSERSARAVAKAQG